MTENNTKNIEDAKRWLLEGKRVKRRTWNNTYLFFDKDNLCLRRKDGSIVDGLENYPKDNWERVFENDSQKLNSKFIFKLKEEKEKVIVFNDEIDKYFPKGDTRREEVLAILGVLNANLNKLIDKLVGELI